MKLSILKMDNSYFDPDVNRDLKLIIRKLDHLIATLDQVENRVKKIEDEMLTMQSIASQVDDIDEQQKKFSSIPGAIASIQLHLKTLLTSQMSSWHRIINTSIRKGDPIPFDPSHSKII